MRPRARKSGGGGNCSNIYIPATFPIIREDRSSIVVVAMGMIRMQHSKEIKQKRGGGKD